MAGAPSVAAVPPEIRTPRASAAPPVRAPAATSTETPTQRGGPHLFTLGTGVTSAESVTGLAVTAGLSLKFGPPLLNGHFVDLIVGTRDADPYYTDEYRCRNGDNGQFAESPNCSPIGFRFGVSAEGALLVPGTRVLVGGGAGAGERHTSTYGSLGFPFGGNPGRPGIVRVSVGQQFVAATIGAGFRC